MSPFEERILYRSIIHAAPMVSEIRGVRLFDREKCVPDVPVIGLNISQKLGHLYEDAILQVLENAHDLRVVGKSIQIRERIESKSEGKSVKGNRTIGELDFLLEDLVCGKYIHLEVAVKFYLACSSCLFNKKEDPSQGVSSQGEGSSREIVFPGPDARDNFDRKLHHLETHQLNLTNLPTVKEQIRDRYSLSESAMDDLEVNHLILGIIFDHFKELELSKHPTLHSRCRRGRWMYVREIKEYVSEEKNIYHVPKQLWPVDFKIVDRKAEFTMLEQRAGTLFYCT